ARLLRVGRTGGPGARAALGLVAFACRRTADGARGREAIGRARRARARARLGHVARAGGRPADRPGVPRRVLAGVAAAVTRVGGARVAVVGAGRAARLLRVGGTARAAARAVLREIALVRRGPAYDQRGGEAVGRAVVRDAVAALGHVADVRRRTADGAGRRLRVGRAGGARPGAGLLRVAGAARGAADRARV